MNKRFIVILLAAFILVSSIAIVSAQDAGQGDFLLVSTSDDESAISDADPSLDENQEVLSDENPSGADETPEVISSQQSSSNKNGDDSSVYLILDNDADKENVHIGDEVVWIVSVKNLGPGIAKNVKVYDKLPEGLEYVKHSLTKGVFDPETGIWNIGNLSVEDGEVILFITTKALTLGEKVNEASVTTDSNNTNNETFEEEEIDVEEYDDNDEDREIKVTKMHETGNPLFLILIALFAIFVPIFKR